MKNTACIRDVQTIAQYKIMQFINANFAPESLEIELIDRQTIRGTDSSGESMLFHRNDSTKQVETT